jgi:hypothetical protein
MHETFRLAAREVKHFFHDQHDQNGLAAIRQLTAALLFTRVLSGLFKIV